MSAFRNPDHRAELGVPLWTARVLAGGSVAAPRTDVRAIARGTHRTRVSEMRLTATRAASPSPGVPGTGRWARHATMERDGGPQRSLGTG